jgi:hypothetical protein
MKLRSHYIFSSGLLSLITVFFIPFLYAVFLAGLISFIGNSFIDYFGHEIKGKYISRTPRRERTKIGLSNLTFTN